jgi:hypothetical protein
MLDLWRRLYSVADRLYALAPWRWMEGEELFGVEDPITGEIGFMYVMGQRGEHFGISRYPGTEGLRVLQALQDCDINDPVSGSEILLSSCQLQLSWEDREEQDQRDKQLVKELGLKYRGSQAWPLFRSYEPSLYPWFLTEAQLSTLSVALEQSLQVFQRLQNDPMLLEGVEENHYLVRVLSSGTWRNEIREVLPAVKNIAVISQIPSLPKLKSIQKKGCVEIDLLLFPATRGDDPEGRPFFPYLLMMVEATNGIILSGFDLLQPFPSLDAMYGKVAEKVCVSLLKDKIVPAEIRVRRELMAGVLAPLADELGLRVKLQKHLPELDRAAQGLMATLRNR